MNVVYAFIGSLPAYCIDTVKQTRLFYDGPLYFIISDSTSPFRRILETLYGVTIIQYDTVKDTTFNDLVQKTYKKFHIVHGLKGREKLFIYSFERFFTLLALMKQRSLTNVFFMELDNLIYADPRLWLDGFKDYQMSYMFDNVGRCSSGIAYIRDQPILEEFCKSCLACIETSTKFLSEMGCLYDFWKTHESSVQLLPVHWPAPEQPPHAIGQFDRFKSLFDPQGVGICLCGIDPFHSGGKLVKGLKNPWGYHDFSKYKYEWKEDSQKRKIPYVWNDLTGQWIQINNLHVHSKDLAPYVSLNI